MKYTPGTGKSVCTFTLAVDRRYQKDGEKEADFIPVIVWNKPAEATANYMNKGKLMGVSGRIQTRTYDAKDGSKRYITEVVADEVQFLEWGNNDKSEGNHNDGGYKAGGTRKDENEFGNDLIPIEDEGEIPF